MIAEEAYVLSKSFTKKSLDGQGALKGAPCTIKSTTKVSDGTNITFEWTGTSGTTQTSTIKVMDGISIIDVDVNTDNTLTCTLSDGSTVTTTNKIKTIKGDDGYSPTITEDAGNTDDIYKLVIADKNGSITTPNLKGGGSSDKFTRDDLTAVTVGGLNSGSSVKDKTTKEVLESILFPYQKPTVSFAISPSTTIYESGTTVSSIIFTINVTKKSNDIQSIKVYDGSTLLTTITSGVANGGTFTYTYSCNITSNTTLKVEVSDGTSTVSATKNITFANKSYYGFVADGTTVNETVIKALQNNVLKISKALNYTGINCTDSKIVYAYPQNQGLLSSILDGSGFDYIDSYDCTNITVDGVNYNVYVMIDPTTLDGFTQKFA